MRTLSLQVGGPGFACLVLAAALTCLNGFGCSSSRFLTLGELRRVYDLPPLPTPASYPGVDAVVVFSAQHTEIYRRGDADLHTQREVHRVVRVLRNAGAFREVVVPARVGESVVSIEACHIDPSGATRDLTSGAFQIVPLDSVLISAKETSSEPALLSPGFVAAYLSGFRGALLGDSPAADRNGSIRERLESETHWSPATGPSTIASPASLVVIGYDGVEPGSVIEYRCVFRRPSVDRFDQWYAQDYLPIQYNEYRLTVPQGLHDASGNFWDWRCRLYRCARIGDPEISVEANADLQRVQTYRWTLRDVAAFQPEIYMPAHDEELEFGRLTHSSWTDWEPLAAWYRTRHLSSAFVPRTRVLAAAESLTAGARSDEARIDRLRRFVQELPTQHRPLDSGNLTPASSEEVLRRRGGDSKDKAVLLVNLLRAVGISADPALLVTKNRGGADSRFPMWSFDRMVVRIALDKSPLWIDAAARGRALGRMPWFCEGQVALVLPAAGSCRLETIPESALADNQTQERIRIDIGAEDARVDFEIEAAGEAGAQWRDFVRSLAGNLDAIASRIAHAWISDFPDAVLGSSEIQGMRDEGRFFLRFSFRTQSMIVEGSPWPSLHALPLDRDFGIGLLALDARRYPVEIGHRWKLTRSVDIDLSGSPYEVQVVPGKASFESADLRFASDYSSPGPRKVRGAQTWEIRSPIVQTRNYDIAEQIGLALEAARGPGFGFQSAYRKQE